MKKTMAWILCLALLVGVAVLAVRYNRSEDPEQAETAGETASVTTEPAAAETDDEAEPAAEEVAAGVKKDTEETTAVETRVTGIQKYGNVELEVKATELLELGFAYGDLLRVELAGQSLEMPLCSNYSDVESGCMVCRALKDDNTDKVSIAVNMGDMASGIGLAEKTTIEEEPGYRWDLLLEEPVMVTISMAEKGAYADEYLLHQLVRTDERADYPTLTDAEFANFRMIATTGMGEGVLYRSSSPINPKLDRNREADAAAEAAGIRTVLNLSDSEESMRAYEGYAGSYYSTLDVLPLNLGVRFSDESFRAGLAEGLMYMTTHEGPYLIHCNEGKDRVGFVAALLESLMGASADEVMADYMLTYYNYFGVEPGTERYETILERNIVKTLQVSFGVEDLREADLSACAADYLRSLGMSDESIAALKLRLSGM